jgi:chromosomal replication initiator protein
LYAAFRIDHPRLVAAYVPAIDFARQLADAIDTQTVEDFIGRFRRVNLLVLDDVHLLSGKSNAQKELLCTFDAITAIGGCVVATSRRAPVQIADFVPGLVGRLVQGLVVPVLPPGPEARLVLLRQLAQARAINLPDAVAHLLAKHLGATAPELSGVLNELEVSARVNGQRVNIDAARQLLAGRRTSTGTTIHQIAVATARRFSVKVKDLRSASRRRAVVNARGIAIYLARNLTGESFGEMGRYFGGRDHTTICHAYGRAKETLRNDPSARQAVLELEELLRAPDKTGTGSRKARGRD